MIVNWNDKSENSIPICRYIVCSIPFVVIISITILITVRLTYNCTRNLCENGGHCQENLLQTKCICPIHTTGVRCETKLLNNLNCSPNGYLTMINNQLIMCRCYSGYTGLNCEYRCGRRRRRRIRRKRIVGGWSTNANGWEVLLNINNTICGGSLITPTMILTAAHCFDEAKTIKGEVYVSAINFQLYEEMQRIESVIIHRDYHENQLYDYKRQSFIYQHYHNKNRNQIVKDDIALVSVRQPFNLTIIQLICLNFDEKIFDLTSHYNDEIIVNGYGVTNDKFVNYGNDLRQTILYILPSHLCVPQLREDNRKTFCTSYNNWLDKRDTCSGDSGSALFIHTNNASLQLGIVSFGHENCNGYSINMNVAQYVGWIFQQHVKYKNNLL
ncbi:hypothetical protein SNEBB_005489 [Seison nebaliae]|nr:hypothetical protein SNEBB_005489 [Seison nebaliae]